MVTGELRVGCAELDTTNYAICNYTYFKHSMLSPLQQPQSFKNPVSIFLLHRKKKKHTSFFSPLVMLQPRGKPNPGKPFVAIQGSDIVISWDL